MFNLGHGIWQETNPDAVARLVDYVHEASVARAARSARMSSEPSAAATSTAGPADLADTAVAYFRDLQARICSAFQSFEPKHRFEERNWPRPEGHSLQGGGWSPRHARRRLRESRA